jgi:hypothetical protein
LLSIGHDGECYVCGNKSTAICEDLEEIDLLAKASLAEISKIEQKSTDLNTTIDSINSQKIEIKSTISALSLKLKKLDQTLEARTPSLKLIDEKSKNFRKTSQVIENDIFIRNRINELNKILQETELAIAPKQYKSANFYPSENAINDFCKAYSKILSDIQFPGENVVTFDYKKFDVIIDGKPRHLNGKGVRAILNSIFKISLLKYCRENDLFHPGLVILDSPLVTYRDPLTSKHGELQKDEQSLAETKISYRFLNYLNSISALGQFIIIENIDIPNNLGDSITVESFYGKGAKDNDRFGLF